MDSSARVLAVKAIRLGVLEKIFTIPVPSFIRDVPTARAPNWDMESRAPPSVTQKLV